MGEPRLNKKESFDNVCSPIEEEIDCSSTPLCGRSDSNYSGDAIHGLLDRPRDGDHRLGRGHYTVVNDDNDAREVGLREERTGKMERCVEACRTEQSDQDQDCPRLVRNKPGKVQGLPPGFSPFSSLSSLWSSSLFSFSPT